MDSSSAEEAAAAAVAAVAAAAAAATSSSSSAQSMHPHPRVIVDHLHAESARPTMDPVKIRDAFQKALWDYHMDLVERAPVNTASTGIRIDEKARKEKSKRKGGGGDAEEDGMGDEDDDAVAGEEDVVERFELCFKPGPGQLPLARVKRVMKCDDEVKMISAEAPILFARACEIFIADLTSRAYLLAGEHKRRTIHRSDIAGAIGRSDLFDFLVDVVPRDEAQAGGRGPAGRKVRKERSGRAEAAEDAAQQAALNGAHGAEANGGGPLEERGEEQGDEQEEGVGDDEHSA